MEFEQIFLNNFSFILEKKIQQNLFYYSEADKINRKFFVKDLKFIFSVPRVRTGAVEKPPVYLPLALQAFWVKIII